MGRGCFCYCCLSLSLVNYEGKLSEQELVAGMEQGVCLN